MSSFLPKLEHGEALSSPSLGCMLTGRESMSENWRQRERGGGSCEGRDENKQTLSLSWNKISSLFAAGCSASLFTPACSRSSALRLCSIFNLCSHSVLAAQLTDGLTEACPNPQQLSYQPVQQPDHTFSSSHSQRTRFGSVWLEFCFVFFHSEIFLFLTAWNPDVPAPLLMWHCTWVDH